MLIARNLLFLDRNDKKKEEKLENLEEKEERAAHFLNIRLHFLFCFFFDKKTKKKDILMATGTDFVNGNFRGKMFLFLNFLQICIEFVSSFWKSLGELVFFSLFFACFHRVSNTNSAEFSHEFLDEKLEKTGGKRGAKCIW